MKLVFTFFLFSFSAFSGNNWFCKLNLENEDLFEAKLAPFLTTNKIQWQKMRDNQAYLQRVNPEVTRELEKDASNFFYRGMNLSIGGLKKVLTEGFRVESSLSRFKGVVWFCETPSYAVSRSVVSWKGEGERLGVVFKVKRENISEDNIKINRLQGGDKTYEVSQSIKATEIM